MKGLICWYYITFIEFLLDTFIMTLLRQLCICDENFEYKMRTCYATETTGQYVKFVYEIHVRENGFRFSKII